MIMIMVVVMIKCDTHKKSIGEEVTCTSSSFNYDDALEEVEPAAAVFPVSS
jgi:hypothetical protein